MIRKIELNTVPFSHSPQGLDDLSTFNYFYGQNGTGKTTISRVINNPDDYSDCKITWNKNVPLETRVYNRDFVETNFSSNPRGVFTLGQDEKTTIKEIEKTKDCITDITGKITNLKVTLQGEDGTKGKRKELIDLDEEYKEKFWTQKVKYQKDFATALEGHIGSKKSFMKKVLYESHSNKEKLLLLDELKERAEKIFDKGIEELSPISFVKATNVMKYENDSVLSQVIVGKKNVDISAMIDSLGNIDWVRQGLNYYKNNSGNCPFCQQETTKEFAISLEEYFDKTYSEAIAKIDKLVDKYIEESSLLQQKVKDIIAINSRYLDSQGVKLEKSKLDTIINKNQKLLERKQREPSQAIELFSINEVIKTLNFYIIEANKKISEHNDIFYNIKSKKAILTKQIWKFIVGESNSDIKDYNSKKENLEEAIKNLNKRIREKGIERKKEEEKLRELESRTTTIKPTCDGINKLLDHFGFLSFKLKISEDKLSYKLVRENGEDARQTLSEGEKNLISFLYFYYLLKGSHNETGINNPKVVVIDDPVSSLDNEVLFIVSTLTRELIQEVREEKGSIKQIFILTHNLYFHKEVTYNGNRRRGKLSEETFWLVKKKGCDSTVESQLTNPVKTSYELLWNEIKTTPRNNITIQNTMRRILESYFKILGNTDINDLYKKFDGEKKIICKALCSWVNDGSHSVFGEDFYTPLDDDMVEKSLKVFKEIFIEQGQTSHYNMMMGEDNTKDD